MARKPTKPTPVEDDELDLEELDDATEETSGKTKGKTEDDVWGVRDLIALIKERTGKEYTPREVRTLLRKMARDGSNRIEREVIAGNKSRYSWSGPDDPEVKTILKAVKGGEIEAGKKEALDKLKADKAAKQAAKGDTPAPKKAKKPAPPADDDELEELDEDDE